VDMMLMPVPLWAVLAIQAISFGICALLYHRLQQRLGGHAESIANMDEWADDVEEFIRRTKSLERQKVVRYAIDPRIADSSASPSSSLSKYRRNRATAH
jgi:hypothetical protein